MGSARQWLNVSVKVSGNRTQTGIEQLLESLGALAVTVCQAGNEPMLEPLPGETPQWEEATVAGLFDGQSIPELIETSILNAFSQLRSSDLSIEWHGDRDYVSEWQRSLEPLRVTENLWICPDGSLPQAATGAALRLTPGLAFGSGEHATTWMCLEWLAHRNLKNLTVVDYGCGSGILGIAAAVLGAKSVHCVDHDPQALTATRENAQSNNVQDHISVYAPDALPALRCELLVANIVLGPLLTLRQHFWDLLLPGGRIALTGVLADQVRELEQAYGLNFFDFEVESRGDWRMLTARRSTH